MCLCRRQRARLVHSQQSHSSRPPTLTWRLGPQHPLRDRPARRLSCSTLLQSQPYPIEPTSRQTTLQLSPQQQQWLCLNSPRCLGPKSRSKRRSKQRGRVPRLYCQKRVTLLRCRLRQPQCQHPQHQSYRSNRPSLNALRRMMQWTLRRPLELQPPHYSTVSRLNHRSLCRLLHPLQLRLSSFRRWMKQPP